MTAAVGVEIVDEQRPCEGCGQPTKVRVYGRVGHHGCIAGMAENDAELDNVIRAARDRLGVDLDQDQAHAVRAYWGIATGGLAFSSGWPGDIGVNAYRWLRSKAGADARGTAGATRLPEGTLDGWTDTMVLHLDYVDADVKPLEGDWLTEVDVNGQFLAAAGIELGSGEPARLDRPRSIAGLLDKPGYVRLATTPKLTPAVNRAVASHVVAGAVLATTTARYLTRQGVELDAAEALIWMEHRRHLSAWYELFRGARQLLMDKADPAAAVALRLVKAVTTTTLGGWLRSDKNTTPLQRRDWSDMIIAESWVRAMIALDRAAEVDWRPIGVRRDGAWFSSPWQGVQPAGMTFSDQLGKWKVARTVQVTPAIVEAHAGGSADLLLRAIIDSQKAAEQ